MRAQLKALDTADSPDGSLLSFAPETPDRFALWVTASIGPANAEGEELFQFAVCSPAGLADLVDLPKGYSFVRHLLVIERWEPALIEAAIRDLCERTFAGTWPEIAARLGRYGHWEFEDYRER
jgi:hypothetical protein